MVPVSIGVEVQRNTDGDTPSTSGGEGVRTTSLSKGMDFAMVKLCRTHPGAGFSMAKLWST